jgi:hypothetical protein
LPNVWVGPKHPTATRSDLLSRIRGGLLGRLLGDEVLRVVLAYLALPAVLAQVRHELDVLVREVDTGHCGIPGERAPQYQEWTIVLSGTQKYVTKMPLTPQIAAMMNVHLCGARQHQCQCGTHGGGGTHFLPRLVWIGVNACVPTAAPALPIAAERP